MCCMVGGWGGGVAGNGGREGEGGIKRRGGEASERLNASHVKLMRTNLQKMLQPCFLSADSSYFSFPQISAPSSCRSSTDTNKTLGESASRDASVLRC